MMAQYLPTINEMMQLQYYAYFKHVRSLVLSLSHNTKFWCMLNKFQ